MTKRSPRAAKRATDREVGVVAAVLVAGSEKAAANRLGLSHSIVKHLLANARSKVGAETTAQLVRILAPRPPEPEGLAPGSNPCRHLPTDVGHTVPIAAIAASSRPAGMPPPARRR
jgi:DNA-binding CsgD family transcriptional regulator